MIWQGVPYAKPPVDDFVNQVYLRWKAPQDPAPWQGVCPCFSRRILRQLGGREHELWTGVVLWRRPGDLQVAWQERSRVAFKALDDTELGRYLATRAWRNNAGAYAIEEQGDPYVRVVEGSLSNVIGLPMESLAQTLRWFAPAVLPPG